MTMIWEVIISLGSMLATTFVSLSLPLPRKRGGARGARGAEPAVSVIGSDLFYVLNRFFLPRFSARASCV